MKNNILKVLSSPWTIAVLLIFGILGSVYSWTRSNTKIGDLASWYSGIATTLGIVFVYLQIIESRKVPHLIIHTYWGMSGYYTESNGLLSVENLVLNIIPENSGTMAASYRLLGICKESDWPDVSNKLDKISENIQLNEYRSIYNKLFFKDELSSEDEKVDIFGNDFLFSTKDFQKIEPKNVGDRIKCNYSDQVSHGSKPKNTIENKLNISDNDEINLIVIFIDPGFHTYTQKILKRKDEGIRRLDGNGVTFK